MWRLPSLAFKKSSDLDCFSAHMGGDPSIGVSFKARDERLWMGGKDTLLKQLTDVGSHHDRAQQDRYSGWNTIRDLALQLVTIHPFRLWKHHELNENLRNVNEVSGLIKKHQEECGFTPYPENVACSMRDFMIKWKMSRHVYDSFLSVNEIVVREAPHSRVSASRENRVVGELMFRNDSYCLYCFVMFRNVS